MHGAAMLNSVCTILLVEDSPADAELLKEALFAGAGAPRLILCGSLAEAGRTLDAQPIDLVLLDLSLPDSLGMDTMRAAAAMMPNVPIIVLTGHDDENAGAEALRTGAQDYLVKGRISTEILSRSIRYAAERHRARQQAEDVLRQANAMLEQKVSERTAELAQRATQLRALAGELTLSEQRERRRMARVLHDHLQQLLVGAKFRATILGRAGDDVVRRGAAEIESLLDESINTSRSLTAELSPPILHDGGLADGLEWLARWMADKHGLTVDLSAEANLPPIEEDVKILLFESVRELLFNAVKHGRVRSASVNLRRIDTGELQVTVSDRGPGFDPRKVRPAGEMGGGFGLFSIRERLDLIGGRMAIDSTPGHGSRVVLTALPGRGEKAAVEVSAEPPAADAPVQLTAPALGARVRVLVADDHEVMRDGLARLLGSEPDIEVVGQAADGKMAVDLARKLRPDVVLMDLGMPRLSGIDATAAITAALPEVRVIGLSMFDESERAQTMFAAGAVAYLTKSGPSQNILSAIRACASGACKPAPPGPHRRRRSTGA